MPPSGTKGGAVVETYKAAWRCCGSLLSSMPSPPGTPQQYFNQTSETEDGLDDQNVAPESYLEIPGDVNMPLFGIASRHQSLGATRSRFDIHLPVYRDGTTYVHLEQEKFARTPHYMQQRISFTRSDHNREGYSISDTLTWGCPLIPLRGSDDIVLHGGAQINIRILWPGYHSMENYYTFSIDTDSARVTRDALLVKIAEGLERFFQEIRNSWTTMRPPKQGSERFTISNAQWRCDQGLSANDVLIMGLHYRGGWDYQPELYVKMQNIPENRWR